MKFFLVLIKLLAEAVTIHPGSRGLLSDPLGCIGHHSLNAR